MELRSAILAERGFYFQDLEKTHGILPFIFCITYTTEGVISTP